VSSKDLQQYIEVIDACLHARDDEAIEDIWLSMQDLCNIDGLMLFVAESAGEADLQSTTVVRSYGINDDWHKLYVSRNYAHIDPVVKMLFETDGNIVSWQKAYKKYGKGAEAFIATATEMGLRDGYSVATTSSDFTGIACSTSVTFESKNLTEQHHELVKTLLPHLNRVMARPGFLKAPKLTDKQIEVLKWASADKSYWEIATIMGISDRTVKFHFKNIFLKLGVPSRGEAVRKGKMMGLI